MRLLTLLAVVSVTMVAQQALPVELGHLPTTWVYELAPACSWRPQRWTYALGEPVVPRIDSAGRRAEWNCLHAKGLKSLIIIGVQTEPKWPSPAAFAEWEIEDASRAPPHPDWMLAPRDD